MARPRTVYGDIVQTFNCSYELKVGLILASKRTLHLNSSAFIREALATACQEKLTEGEWQSLMSYSDPAVRHRLLMHAMHLHPMLILRDKLDNLSNGPMERNRAMSIIDDEIGNYIQTLTVDRDYAATEIPLCVALHELTDILGKIRTHLKRLRLSPTSVKEIISLARRLPPGLRAEIETATLTIISLPTLAEEISQGA